MGSDHIPNAMFISHLDRAPHILNNFKRAPTGLNFNLCGQGIGITHPSRQITWLTYFYPKTVMLIVIADDLSAEKSPP